MGIAEAYRLSLVKAQSEARKARQDPSRWPFRYAAAVLSRFKPATLRPAGSTADATQVGWGDFLLDCNPSSRETSARPPANEESGAWWQLRDSVRRETLRRMGTRERMQQALLANPDRPDDEVQRALTAVINATPLRPLSEMSREEVSALVIIHDWLGGILDNLPSETDLRRALVIAETLAPMQRLAGGGKFVGRQNELAILRSYVGVVPSPNIAGRVWSFLRDTYYDFTSRPPLLITGPGGAGKSSLVARLILDHSEKFDSPEALPFVYLDLDRATLDPAKPMSLIAEAATQLCIEWPHLEKDLSGIAQQIGPLIQFEQSESFYSGSRNISIITGLVFQFGKLLATGSGLRPVLFVIDTFEEAQFRGFDIVLGLGRLLAELQKAAPMLRIVLAGRADLQDQTSALPTTVVSLGNLSKVEALELLRLNIKGSVSQDLELLQQIVDLVGYNPLSLKLASAVINDQGIKDLQGVDTRGRFLLRVKAEVVQSRLYGRIFAHVHDDDAKKLLNPGLLLRRLTADVIREVLAGPCNISLDHPQRAEELMELLSREVALFVREPDGSLRHRPELRRVMLKDLAEALPAEKVREIHDRAVTYYSAQPAGPVVRAEEIYHRLLRGDDPSSIEPRWISGVEPHLQTALEEVPSSARIWLSRRLGVMPDRALLAKAELEDWETITSGSVRRLLNAGEAREALSLMGKRSDRSLTSPLYQLESEALRLLGRFRPAREVAERGVAASARAGAPALQRDLLMQVGLILETEGDAAAALPQVQAAMHVPGDRLEPMEALRLALAELRLLRKIGPQRDRDRQEAVGRALGLLTPELQDDLNQHPALLREVVAELGPAKPDLLNQALEVLGLESADEAATQGIANALSGWDEKLSVERGGATSEIAQRAGLKGVPKRDLWQSFVFNSGTRELSSNILNWRAEMRPDPEVDQSLIDFYRSGVEAALLPRRSDVR